MVALTEEARIPAYYQRETSVVAALLLQPELLREAREVLGDGDDRFEDRPCGAVFRSMVQLFDENAPITGVSLWARLSQWGDEAALVALEDALAAGSKMSGPNPAAACRRRMQEMAHEPDRMTNKVTETGASADRTGEWNWDDIRVLTLTDVLTQMQSEPPRIQTGIAPWDACTDGGFKQKALTVVMGPPGSGKTTLLAQVARNMAAEEIAVGWLGIDEGVSSIVMRHLQAQSVSVAQAKIPDGQTVAWAQEHMGQWAMLFFEDGTVESAIEELARRYPERKRALIIDSLQTARTRDSKDISEIRLRVDNLVHTVKRLAKHPETECSVIATCEVSRASYRSRASAQNIDAIAAAKESGSIEFQADAMMDIRNVKNAPDLVTVEAVKVRGPNTKRGAVFTLRLDRATACFQVVEEDATSLEGLEKDAAHRALIGRVLQVVRDNPGCTSNFVHTTLGGKKSLVLAALEGLELRTQIEGGQKQKKSWKLVPQLGTGSGNWSGTGTGSAGSRPLGAEPAASGDQA